MGLLDSIQNFAASDEGMGLAQGLLSARGSAGLAAGLAGMNAAKDNAIKRDFIKMQMQDAEAQMQQRRAIAERERMAMEALQRKQGALGSIIGQPGGATDQVNAALPSDLRIGALPAMPNSGGIDWRRGLAAGYTPKELQDMAALRNINQEEVARTLEGKDAQGRPVTYQMDKFGRQVGAAPIEQWKAPMQVSLGDTQTFVDPVTLQKRAAFPMGQSPDSKASNAVAWANNSLARQRLEMDRSQQDRPQWIESLGGFANPRTQQVMPARDMQGNPIEGAGPKMTEDQAKATGWLVQAQNAFSNMKDAMSKDKDAMRPGLRETIAGTPYIGGGEGVANAMRSPDRQRFVQGASSLSEALLRAATGAGVNKDEANQKIRELTPQYTDSPEVVAQKMAAIPLYIESLNVRAGPGAKKAAAIMGNSGGGNGGWSIQKE